MPQVVKQNAAGLTNVAFCGRQIPENIWLKLFCMEEFGGVGDGAEVAPPPGKLGIAPRFFADPDAGFPLRRVAVVVILVHRHHRARSIDPRLPSTHPSPPPPLHPTATNDQ